MPDYWMLWRIHLIYDQATFFPPCHLTTTPCVVGVATSARLLIDELQRNYVRNNGRKRPCSDHPDGVMSQHVTFLSSPTLESNYQTREKMKIVSRSPYCENPECQVPVTLHCVKTIKANMRNINNRGFFISG